MVPVRIISVVLLSACGAVCQQPPETPASSSLPDAPSAQVSARTEPIQTYANEAGLPLIRGAAAVSGDVTRESRLANLSAQQSFALLYRPRATPKESGDFFEKYLYPSLLKRRLNYRPAPGDSLMGRATYAASHIFVTRDESGKGRLNTSYFMAVLTTAAVHSAYRPYYRRSASQPFNDFGSAIGNDAGMNLFREFGPSLQQLMKSHAPKFVYRIEERIGAGSR
jgi:hypothetical protein